jgi:hypothetical protein
MESINDLAKLPPDKIKQFFSKVAPGLNMEQTPSNQEIDRLIAVIEEMKEK